MLRTIIIALLLLAALSVDNTSAQTSVPTGLGEAGSWVYPCELFEEQASGQALKAGNQRVLAALCQGLFSGVMSVNYVSPPYLPFCERDDATQLEYVRTFLSFMTANPSFTEKPLGLALLVALGRAYPKVACMTAAP